MEIEKILVKYGFSENEVQVYLCLLRHADISAFGIAKETGLPRSSVYHILDILENQGLVSTWKKNDVRYFSAESPNRLVKKLDEKKELIQKILPEMLNMRNASELTPTARLYSGAEGMKIVWDDILETLERKGIKELHAITHHKIHDHLPRYFPKWVKKRESLGIKTLAITTDIPENKGEAMTSNKYRETRLLPSNSPIKGTVDIYANKIAFFSTKEDEVYSIVIESNSISEVMRQFFLSTWQLLGEKNILPANSDGQLKA